MRRNNYKGKSKPKAKFAPKREEVKESANDPSWYTVANQLTKDVASLSFNNPTGIEYTLGTGAAAKFVGPGVMSIYMAPVPGYSAGLSSPINIAAKNIYSYVRYANSGHANYDSPDLMLMILAMDNAYAYYGWLVRLYGMLRVYSQSNRYLGTNMLLACGVDANNLVAHIADLRAYINQYALKLSAINVPSVMSIFKRHMWMFTNVFKDENTSKAQFYMYNPAYLYKYDEYNGAGRLLPVPLCLDATGATVTGMTYAQLINYGDTLLGALIGSEDVGIMSGDILKAYGEGNIWKLELIDENFAIAPMFSEEVLSQIHNTNFTGNVPVNDDWTTPGWGSFEVHQDTSIGQGCLVCKPRVIRGANVEGNHILDFWKEDVTPEDVIVATRNTVGGSYWTQYNATEIWTCGTEIPIQAIVWNLTNSGTLATHGYYWSDDIATFNTTLTSYDASAAFLSKLMFFNEHPYIILVDYSGSAPVIRADASLGEISNFTIIDNQELEKMHLSAILSEFAVPLLGNVVK